MIIIYKLGDDFTFHEYDKWDGKFLGELSDLKLSRDEVIKRFNTTYYRTTEGDK